MPAEKRPSGGVRDQRTEPGRHRDLHERAGNGDPPHGEELLHLEMEADAEHQEDDADLGELGREAAMRDEARGEGPDRDPGEEVADDRGEAKALADEPEHERCAQPAGERQDQTEIVHAKDLLERDNRLHRERIPAVVSALPLLAWNLPLVARGWRALDRGVWLEFMKPVTLVLSLAVGLTVSLSARAQSATLAPVRIDASSDVVLELVQEGEVGVVCRAPCDRRLDTEVDYRISGRDVRPSSLFRVQPESTTIAIKPKSNGSFEAGVILLAISGAFMVGGALAVALPFVISPNGGQGDEVAAAILSAPLFTAGLATGIPGTILVANNYQSGARPLPTRTGRAVTVPLLSLSF